MTDGTPDPIPARPGDACETDACVDALGQALSLLKAAEAGGDGPSLAEIMRLVRLMENQPEHAMAKLRSSLDRWSDVPTPEKIRRAGLQKLGHTEASLRALPGPERDAVESAIAGEIRRHYGIAHLPAQRRSRPAPFAPYSF